jgi:hypothetical protein
MIDIPATQRCRVGERESESLWCSSPLLHRREFLPCLILHIIGLSGFNVLGQMNTQSSPELRDFHIHGAVHLPSHSWSLSLINICASLYSLKPQQVWSQATNKALNAKAREQSTMGVGQLQSRAPWGRGSQRPEHHGRGAESRAPWEQAAHEAESSPTNDSFKSGFTRY